MARSSQTSSHAAFSSSTVVVVLLSVVAACSISIAGLCVEGKDDEGRAPLSRRSFPKGFLFGAGSAAYQYEGAAHTDGRGLSVWDVFAKEHPEKIADGSDGKVAEDFYHRYKGDVKLMKEMGLDSFRFSISWSRILPQGKISGGINKLGIEFYNNLINELLANGIKPFVTIFHWDVPQALVEEYGGFLSPKIVNDFRDYANVVFEEFGDKVKYWSTVNEPNIMSQFGYATGVHAPGRCSDYIGNCSAGNSGTEPYIVGHHLLLCHGVTVELYRNKYQAHQMGKIGITTATTMIIPSNNTINNNLASSRANDFTIGWFLDPVVYGEYPKTMRSLLGNRLPKFTTEENKLLKQSFDFLGLNYYTANYATESLSTNNVNLSYTTDYQATLSGLNNGIPIGETTPVSWLYIYPKGLQTLLHYIKTKYNNPIVMITENGMGDANSGSLAQDPNALKDTTRIKYHNAHLSFLLDCIKEGVNVKGYYVWTFMDDFEWFSGYSVRFGFTFIDFNNGLKRYPKDSFYWFKNFLAKE